MTTELVCDGCGQTASAEHIAKRLQRLEWTTRYRPVHIGTVLLGAFAPEDDAEFLYAVNNDGEWKGPAKELLAASGVSRKGKSREAALAEFQRAGYLLTYVLECPLNRGVNDSAAIQGLLGARLPALLARLRRSLRPKRLVPISSLLDPWLGSLGASELGCSVVLDDGKAFAVDVGEAGPVWGRLRRMLTGAVDPAR
jgi:hypothetical protein